VSRRRLLVFACALVVLLIGVATAAADRGPSKTFTFTSCGLTPQAVRTQCATADLPLDYDRPNGQQVHIAVARVPAAGSRQGVLFFNFGGPGGAAVAYLQVRGASTLWHALNEHFDIIAFDPRGVGQSTPGIDCKANQETDGIYSQPFTTPFNVDRDALVAKVKHYIQLCQKNNGDILEHVSTANVARDIDQIRSLLGETKINYFGYSYGTFLGATYANLFPNRYRAMVLDGPVDATRYINRPWQNLAEQTAGFERARNRFFQACAADQAACAGFGGSDPWDAYDQLVDQANAHPIPAPNSADPRPVDGDDINFAAANELYAKEFWGELAEALAEAEAGDGSFIRDLVDGSYGRNDDGTYGNGLDLYFTIGASEERYPRDVDFYLDRGDEAWGTFNHDYWNNGYPELNYGLWPSHDRDSFDGPFKLPNSAPTPLVVATTYDPATPYNGALRLVRDLGNARLITMRGDGHTAYGGESACIDAAVEAYVNTLALPAVGTSCTQDTPFLPLTAFAKAKVATAVENRHSIVGRVPQIKKP
jgi:pimeloyl-ACP methyl ester carboxylesterase